MPSSSSRSKRWSSGVVAFALVGACSTPGGWLDKTVEVVLDGPGGAQVTLEITGASSGQSIRGELRGFITHAGPEACHVAIYVHSAPPDAAAIPVLGLEPAPEGPGELLFDTVIPSSGDRDPYVREIESRSGPEFSLVEDDALRAWFTIATCAQPEVHVEFVVETDFIETPHRRSELSVRLEVAGP